jgi:hypothetical protein
MATAVLSGRIDAHGYGLPSCPDGTLEMSGVVSQRSVRGSRTCARDRCPGSWPRWSRQGRHARAVWQSLLREEKAPLLKRIEVQGNLIESFCQEANDCAGVCCVVDAGGAAAAVVGDAVG